MPRRRIYPIRYSDPIVQFVVEESSRRKLKQEVFAKDVGIYRRWAVHWQTGSSPTVSTLRAALNALGYDLQVVKLGDPA